MEIKGRDKTGGQTEVRWWNEQKSRRSVVAMQPSDKERQSKRSKEKKKNFPRFPEGEVLIRQKVYGHNKVTKLSLSFSWRAWRRKLSFPVVEDV